MESSDRMNPQARRMLEHAQDEARRLEHAHVGTEHLLLGILADGEDSSAGRALAACGATLDGCRSKVAEAVPREAPVPAAELALTDRARRAVERADRLSLRRRDPSVDAGHLLVSVLDVEGRAGQVLRGIGVDPGRLRASVDLSAGSEQDELGHGATDEGAERAAGVAEAAASERPEPRCAACDADLGNGVAHRVTRSVAADGRMRRVTVVYCPACGVALGVLAGP